MDLLPSQFPHQPQGAAASTINGTLAIVLLGDTPDVGMDRHAAVCTDDREIAAARDRIADSCGLLGAVACGVDNAYHLDLIGAVACLPEARNSDLGGLRSATVLSASIPIASPFRKGGTVLLKMRII
jgi:hypothetical protein